MLSLKFPKKNSNWLDLDPILLVVLVIILIVHYLNFFPSDLDDFVLTLVALIATLPVVWSAIKALKEKHIGIDLLASIALVFSLLAKEYTSAVFINLMLTSARILGVYTKNR